MVKSAYKKRAAVKPPYSRSGGSILHKVLFLCLCQCLGLVRLARAFFWRELASKTLHGGDLTYTVSTLLSC